MLVYRISYDALIKDNVLPFVEIDPKTNVGENLHLFSDITRFLCEHRGRRHQDVFQQSREEGEEGNIHIGVISVYRIKSAASY